MNGPCMFRERLWGSKVSEHIPKKKLNFLSAFSLEGQLKGKGFRLKAEDVQKVGSWRLGESLAW